MAPSLPHSPRSRFAILLASLIALLLAAAPAAQAGPLVSSAASCEGQTLEQPFLPWLDPAQYVLAPGGTLEQGTAGWTLTGGAAVASGNEPYYVHGAGESSSLALPAGGSATTGSMCVGIEHPTIRLFARNAGSALATLGVEVLFEDATGEVRSLAIGNLTAGPSFEPSVQMPVVANLLPLLPGEHTAVAFRFTPAGGDWAIDDVYVDPYHR